MAYPKVVRMRGFLLAAGLSAALVLVGCDTVTVNNSAGEIGLLVDGQSGPDAINDFRVSGDAQGTAECRVGTYTAASSPARNEVIGFGEGRAPTRLQTNWTPDDDSFEFDLEQPVAVDLTFWIVQGPVETATFRINTGLVASDQIWAAENAGLFIGDVDIIDATSDPDITDAILNSVGGNNRNWDDFSNDIGLESDRLNVYWINTVEGSTTTGWSDFGARIVMGFDSTDHLVTHEIGHALSLEHPGNGSQFGSQNVMAGSSNSRSFLTEGQTFRAHFDPGSAVNAIYNARPGQPMVNSHPNDGAPEYPELVRRIWADGSSFPPN